MTHEHEILPGSWNEIVMENEGESRVQLDEDCPACGVRLGDHYDHRGDWKPCEGVSR